MFSYFKKFFKFSEHVKTDCTIQMEGAECGAASLCTILKFYGRYVPLSELRLATGISRDGANAKFIVDAAKEYGLDANAFKANKFYLNSIASFPAIAFWGYNHFLVIERLDNSFAYLADPAQGRYRVSLDYFYKKFAGILIECKPTDKFVKSGKKVYNLTKVLDIVRPYKFLTSLYFLTIITATIPVLFIAGAVALFTNEILLSGKFDLALPTFWLILIASLVAISLNLLSQVINRRLTYLMTKDMAAQAFQKLQTVPMSFLESRFDGELAQRALLAIQIPEMISGSFLSFFANLIVATGVLIITFFISLQIGLIFLVGFILNISLVLFLTSGRLDLNVSYAIASAEATSITLEGISNLEVLKSCGLEFDFLERWIKKYIKQVNQSQILLRDVAKTSVVSTASKFLFSASIYTVGGFLIFYTSGLSIGSLISLQFLVAMISTPFVQIPRILYSMQMLDGQLGRYLDLMNNEDDIYSVPTLKFTSFGIKRALVFPHNTNTSVSSLSKTSLVLKDLDLRFNAKLPLMLHDFNLDFSEADHLALVGNSGCGKSTVLKIIAGFLVQTSGTYLINNEPWDSSRTHAIRQIIGYVPQSPALFNGTLRDNLTLFNSSDISDDEIYSVAQITGVDTIINSHSQLLDYNLCDGANNLSGGQRQLIEITRVLLRKPEILLLDESTSALDGPTEEFVLNNIWSSGFRTISAAHRLLSATMGDQIAFIDDGKIVEIGHPKHLASDPNSRFSQLISMESA